MEAYEYMSASTSQLKLPCYSPSLPSPDYSVKPAEDERLLDQTLRASREANSLFIKKAGKTTIVLNDQEEGATMPTYGRNADISGNLFFEQSHSILDITLKVEGKLETMVSDSGGRTSHLLRLSQNIWSHSTSRGATCPEQLEFNVTLPTTFKHNGESGPLPPSYHVSYFSLPSLFVRASYQLHLVVTRARHQKMGLFTKTKHILVPFTYLPRTRPHRPIIPSPGFFSSVKTSPEEWYQAVSTFKTRPNATIDPVNAHLFIPGGRIYGMKDAIPFHLQLSGKTCSLQHLFSEARLDRITSIDSHNTAASDRPPPKSSGSSKPLIRVYILRQTSVGGSRDAWKNSVISEGTLWPTPPDLCPCCSYDGVCSEGHVDWEGELQCNEGVTVGGFSAANVTVKDFIVLSLTPPEPARSQLQEMQVTIPIRLVTESWAETTGGDHRDSMASQFAM